MRCQWRLRGTCVGRLKAPHGTLPVLRDRTVRHNVSQSSSMQIVHAQPREEDRPGLDDDQKDGRQLDDRRADVMPNGLRAEADGVQKRYLAGRKPPRKSDTSVCWLQLMMCSRCPRRAAASWHTVVFPVPVSPTSRHGSLWSRHLQRRIVACRYCMVRPPCSDGSNLTPLLHFPVSL